MEAIGHAVERALRTTQFDFDHKDQLWQAWQDYRLGHAARCGETLTFDRALERSPLFWLL